MDRITHQSPRQQVYGSTSSLRNDSLKHMRKHERRREESNQETKQPGSGGLSGQAGRTVCKGHADCPAGYRGLSAPLPRTVQPEPRTVRKRQQILQRRIANNGPSAGCTRTVHQAPADCPPGTRGPSETSPNQNSKTPQIESEAEQEHEDTRRTGTARTVRQVHADRPRGTDRAENYSTPKVNTPNPSPDLPNGRSC
jgi:hypothetical protein